MDRKFARRRWCFASILFGAVICLAAVGAHGEIITFDPSLPPSTGGYASPRQMSVEFDGLGFSIVLHNLIIKPYANLASQTPSGADILDSYPAGVSVQASGFGAIPFGGGFGGGGNGFGGGFGGAFGGGFGGFGGPFAPPQTNPVDTEEFGKNGNTTGTFNTEMLSLSLSGSINDNPVLLRESPTLMSTGQTTITDLGGGLFRMTSFFDVFTELSIDGGQTWMPANAPLRVELEPVPEPATAAILLATCGAVGLAFIWRKGRRHS